MGGISRIVLGLSPLLAVDATVATTNPWLGTWVLRQTSVAQKPETLVYSDAGGGAMRMESIENRDFGITRFDGRPAADQGPGGVPGGALAIKALSPRRYRWTFSIKGKAMYSGLNTLAADGRSFREVSWPAGKPARVKAIVYERKR